ncbi:peptidoglycan-binding protein, partial [Bacillus daqingensis]
EGIYTVNYIYMIDHAGNSTIQYARDVDFLQGLDFEIVYQEAIEPSVTPLDDQFILNSTLWQNEYIDGDLYIGPEAVLSVMGNVHVTGDVYVYGALQSYGGLRIDGTMFARSAQYGGSSPYYNGSVHFSSGSNSISRQVFNNSRWNHPLVIDEENVYRKDGDIIVEGAAVPVFDLYVGNQQASFNQDGTFEHVYENSDAESISIHTIDVFGFTNTTTMSVREYGLPAWPAESELAVSNLTDSSVTVSWPEAIGDETPAAYQVFVNGEEFTQTSNDILEAEISGLEPNVTYTIGVKAEGTEGLMSSELKKEITTEKSEEMLQYEAAIEEAVAAIDALPSPEDLTLNEDEVLTEARMAVTKAEELGGFPDSERLEKLQALEQKRTELLEEAVKEAERQSAIASAEGAISQLPSVENVTLDDQERVRDARRFVEAAVEIGADASQIMKIEKLDELEQRLVELQQEYEDAQAKQAAYEIAQEAIYSLPSLENVSLEDTSAVEAVRNQVEDAFKLGVTREDFTDYEHLTAVENRLTELEKEAYVNELTASVETAIDGLPELQDLAVEDKEALQETREKVNEAVAEGVSLNTISNLEKLTALEELMLELIAAKELAEQQANVIGELEQKISEMPDLADLTLADEERVETIREMIREALELGVEEAELPLQQEWTDLQNRLAELEAEAAEKTALIDTVNQQIAALPGLEQLTLENTDAVKTAREAVNNALEEGVAIEEIEQAEQLEQLENRIAELKMEQEERKAREESIEEARASLEQLPSIEAFSLEFEEQIRETRAQVEAAIELGAEFSENELLVLEELEALLEQQLEAERPLMEDGDENEDIRELKFHLTALGFGSFPVEPSMRFGPVTAGVVQEFQEYFGLRADGVVRQETVDLLYSIRGSIYNDGGAADEIVTLKEMLTELGFGTFPQNPSNRYGSVTMGVVSEFQQANDLRVSGIADPVTLAELERQYEEATRPLDLPYRDGQSGREIVVLKENLTSLGFGSFPQSPSNRYGPVTAGVVTDFQQYFGLTETGEADEETLAVLTEVLSSVYTDGGEADEIVTLKEMLTELGFGSFPQNPSNRYGPVTMRVVSDFQEANGLRVSGIADPVTLAELEKQYEEATRPLDLPYRDGQSGDEIVSLKEDLTTLGFGSFPQSPSNRYGPVTAGVVSDFQQYFGLDVTGEADQETLNEIISILTSVYIDGGVADEIVTLKEMLTEAGFGSFPQNPSNRYGPVTMRVVSDFQETNGLRVSGIADPVTLALLNDLTN